VDKYLENTRAPETFANAGGPQYRIAFGKSLMSKVYPQMLHDDKDWDAAGSWWLKPKAGIEQFMAHEPGAYLGALGYFGMVPILRGVGLPALTVDWNAGSWDEVQYQAARVEDSLIEHPERAEALIARYKQANEDLDKELQPQTITRRVRVLMIGASSNGSSLSVTSYRNVYELYFLRLGLENAASKDLVGLRMDVERILAMDPDMILMDRYGNETPQEFMRDPRWRGLKAVKEKRVYESFGQSPGGSLILQPLYNRWMAELAYPDRLQPRVRQLLRDRYITEFNYRLGDEQIDKMLNVEENRGLPGVERFDRDDQADQVKEPPKDTRQINRSD
jgi:ABC-type Fe3+-hydroxamate transport system substrate-binding protein